MRNSPHPLSVHLGMVAANLSGIQRCATKRPAAISQSDAIAVVRGIKMYQDHPFVPKSLSVNTIWNDGSVSVNSPIMDRSAVVKRSEFPLLIVPSLINQGNILDISEEKSMLRWLNFNGIDAYLLDWGSLSCERDKGIDIDILIQEKLYNAIQSVSKKTGKKVDVMGYCMGGTLLVAGYPYINDHIRRMVLLAAPWDFQVGSYELSKNVRIWSASVMPEIEKRGVLPAEWMQTLFITLDPNGSTQKFIRFASMDQNSSEAKLFVSVEDWLNNGVDLPGNIAQHCIKEWFVNNTLAKDQAEIIGNCTKASDLDVLIIASRNDALVPYESALSVKNAFVGVNIDVVTPVCGHIGLIVGSNAKEGVWKPMFDWLIA